MVKILKSLKLQAFILYLFISVFLVSTWFRGEFIYGGAEVGLFTFNPEISLGMSRYAWWDAWMPGQLIPQFITGVPTYFFFYILKLGGLSPQNIQQLFFTSVLFLMGFGVFLLSFDILDETRKKYSLAAGLFYMFNAYTLVQVWHRFVYSTILLAAVLPFLILFWRKWIREGKIFHLIIFLLINFLSAYIYGNLAAIVTVWAAFMLVSFTELAFPWTGKINAGKIIYRFFAGYIFWILTNIWWIAPTFLIAPGLLSEQHSGEDNLATLVVISRQTVMPYLLQLVNPFYLFLNSELGTIYSNIIFKIIPWIMTGLIFLGLIIGLKIKHLAKYSVIFIISILLSKGAAIPFSYPYIFGFEHSYFLGILRNPFEKLGVMLPLFGAILFALGMQNLFTWGTKNLGSVMTKLFLVLVFTALMVYAWPMWGGKVFGTKKWPVRVKVPESYIEANNWLQQQKESQGVILHLPFSGRDVVTYGWEEGYHGVDQNEILFASLPSLSRVVGLQRIDDTLNSLTYIFSPQYKDKDKILKQLQYFNVRFIVLHKDINWEDKDTYGDKGDLLDPGKIESVLNSLEFLKKEREFGSLIIYKLSDKNFRPILTLANNVQIVYPGASDILQILSKTANRGDVITPIFDEPDNAIIKEASQVLIFPQKKINYFESSPRAMFTKADDLFNRIVQIRDYFISLGDLQSKEVVQDLIIATQRLSRLSSTDQLAAYKESMASFLNKYNTSLNIHRLFSNSISDMLRLHLAVLKQMGDTDIPKIIEDSMLKWELLPEYKTTGQIFKFNVLLDGNYDLLLPFNNKEADIKVNGVNIASESGVVNNKGTYEISSNSIQASKEDIVLQSEGRGKPMSNGEILSFKKESPVKYKGRIYLEKAAFINFAQGFHPGWTLSLNQNGKIIKINQHFLGNLYDNIWWVDKIGDYDFTIEFSPQKTVDQGITLSVGAGAVLLLAGGVNFLKRRFRK